MQVFTFFCHLFISGTSCYHRLTISFGSVTASDPDFFFGESIFSFVIEPASKRPYLLPAGDRGLLSRFPFFLAPNTTGPQKIAQATRVQINSP
jgi:hypothetical protein